MEINSMFTIYHMATRGGKWSIALLLHEDGTYCIREYRHTNIQGVYWMGEKSAVDAVTIYNQRIDDAAKYDGIFYTKDLKPILDTLEVA
jgi:hypothetical protein